MHRLLMNQKTFKFISGVLSIACPNLVGQVVAPPPQLQPAAAAEQVQQEGAMTTHQQQHQQDR